MILLRWTLWTTVLYSIVIGLWDHSWQLILAGVAVAVLWPLVAPDAEDAQATRGKGSF